MWIAERWTAERDAELLRRWESQSASEIGREMGVTRNAVIGRYHRLQRSYAGYESKQRIEKRHESAARMKEALKLEQSAIERMKARIASGIERDSAIRLAVRDGARQIAIALDLGMTRQRVSQIILS
jgi:hypothetical protein